MIRLPAFALDACGRDEEANPVLLAPFYLRDQVSKTVFLVTVQVSLQNSLIPIPILISSPIFAMGWDMEVSEGLTGWSPRPGWAYGSQRISG